MLTIVIPSNEKWNEITEEFIYSKSQTIQLEHSLVSISKWEAKWKKPFLSSKDKTNDETLDYIRCMTITQNVSPEIYFHLTKENLKDIEDYIESSMTATIFSRDNNSNKGSTEIITSEIIYYWMITLNIPFECQKWHIKRLLTLIKVCDIKNQTPQKQSTRDIMIENTRINEERKRRLNTKG